ncbi:hypothetical protein BpHYR1_030465 [Brachionus plicatilis]|uniref:Uncharacterized protein n=1 Tax=Brachionus plicatilis TaxID=10195 RepID=A0A3M7RWL3_BRAPC|nr:hypothetical protein BpHYR1_030465 [Brachionus plicatilis]
MLFTFTSEFWLLVFAMLDLDFLLALGHDLQNIFKKLRFLSKGSPGTLDLNLFAVLKLGLKIHQKYNHK